MLIGIQNYKFTIVDFLQRNLNTKNLTHFKKLTEIYIGRDCRVTQAGISELDNLLKNYTSDNRKFLEKSLKIQRKKLYPKSIFSSNFEIY